MTEEEEDIMFVVCADQVDPTLVFATRTPPQARIADVAASVKIIAGVGKPYAVLANDPALSVGDIAWDPTARPLPIVNNDVAINEAAITEMLQDDDLQQMPNSSISAA